MIATRNYFAFLPLSNWLLIHDRYGQVLDKSNLPRARFPNCWYLLDSTSPPEHVAQALEKTRSLVSRLGVPGDRVVRVEARLEVGPGKVEPNTFTGTGVGWRWPHVRLPLHAQGWVDESGGLLPCPPETITARAYALSVDSLKPWAQCAPRSFSVLPIAQACNARCAFCFSKASVSRSTLPGRLDMESISSWSARARHAGARRAVITGGGEPTLLKWESMQELVQCLGADYDSVLLITNGSRLLQGENRHGRASMLDILRRLGQEGLTRVAVSRHGVDEQTDRALMGIGVDGAQVLGLLHEAGLSSRLICVLQRGGVATPQDVEAYLARAAKEGTTQVCFKELYVSALSENPLAPSAENQYCQAHQVPLSVAICALERLGFTQAYRLPWGSPVYEGQINGVGMKVAAYTEPSVGWERRHGIVRSWNWLANGSCMASLEDPASALER